MSTKITEKSYISIGLLITIITVTVWISGVSSSVVKNTAEIIRLRNNHKKVKEEYAKIQRSLGRIEGALGIENEDK